MNEQIRKMYAGDKLLNEALDLLNEPFVPHIEDERTVEYRHHGRPVFAVGAGRGVPLPEFRQTFNRSIPARNFFLQEQAAHGFNLHEHQRQAMAWLQSQPDVVVMLEGEVSYMDFKLRLSESMPTRAIGFGYPQHQMIINPRKHVPIIEDTYLAPPKAPKDWASHPAIRAGYGNKSAMALLQMMYRATKPNIYHPTFDWENHSLSTRRKLHTIQHVNVGTVGHIDWGNNRMKRTRPYFPGYLADCIRAAIAEFK